MAADQVDWVWDISKKMDVRPSENRQKFMSEIAAVCRKYNLSIAHEDGHGAFIVEKFSETNLYWLMNADEASEGE